MIRLNTIEKKIKLDHKKMERIKMNRDIVNINSNTQQTNIVGTLSLNLSSLLNQIISLKYDANSIGFIDLEITRHDRKIIRFKIPPINFSKFFNPQNFNSNFSVAFQDYFPTKISSLLFYGLTLNIINDLPSFNNSTLNPDEIKSFRFVVCVIFGLLYDIKLNNCYCYPSNQSELNAIGSGIGMNCINLECKNYLLTYPEFYDDLVHSDCPAIGVQAAFVSISAFAGGNINFQNMNINQTFDCIMNNSQK